MAKERETNERIALGLGKKNSGIGIGTPRRIGIGNSYPNPVSILILSCSQNSQFLDYFNLNLMVTLY